MMKMMSAMMSNKEGMEAFSNMMNPKEANRKIHVLLLIKMLLKKV